MPSKNSIKISDNTNKNDPIFTRVLHDQLFDVQKATFVAVTINIVLSFIVLYSLLVTTDSKYSIQWFCLLNFINIIRLIHSYRISKYKSSLFFDSETLLREHIRIYQWLTFLSGLCWSLVALLTDLYKVDNYEFYLIIVAGICAGSVTNISSNMWFSINFIMPPLLITGIALFFRDQIIDYMLVISIILFIISMVRGAVLGHYRFVESSRLKHEATEVAQAMERMSMEDPLTGLLNRRGLENALEHLKSQQEQMIGMLIDLDGFKAINDTYGHKTGDELLVVIAARLRRSAPLHAIIARIGGDEFAVLYPARYKKTNPETTAKNIITSLIKPYSTAGTVQIGACIGISYSGFTTLSELLLSADMALYEAKNTGRNEYYVFDEVLQKKLARRQMLETDMEQALHTQAISNWFQPIIDLTLFKVSGFEALLRWNHPVHGAIPAPEIVQIARDIGQLDQLTHHVFENCCAMLVNLREAGRDDIIVAMNLSSRELASANIERMIVNGFQKYNIGFSSFEIEITEDAPIDHFTVEDTLARLSGHGISIAIDDFGTGFSTLASLKSGMINKVKIDKSFIARVALSKEDRLLVKAVVDLGLAMKMEVVAEGVENAKNLRVLKTLGCRKAQGYLFSPAMLPDEAIRYALKQDGTCEALLAPQEEQKD